MTTNAILHVDFSNYWHAGSGRSSGYHLDALCERDDSQLPVLPGRQLKGLLRHAVHRAEAWGWLDEYPLPEGPLSSHEEVLFGSRSHSESRSATQPGLLDVDTARLPTEEHQWLAHPEQTELREELFAELFSTAINELGSAQRFSLRGLQVCIPLQLQACLSQSVTANDPALRAQQHSYITAQTAWQVLDAALPLLDALGAHRSRGLGEAQVTLSFTGQGA